MVENSEYELNDESDKHDLNLSNPNDQQRVDDKMKSESLIDNEIHATPDESAAETQNSAGQISGQLSASDSAGSSTGKQDDVRQSGDQTTVSSSESSLTSMSDEELQKE